MGNLIIWKHDLICGDANGLKIQGDSVSDSIGQSTEKNGMNTSTTLLVQWEEHAQEISESITSRSHEEDEPGIFATLFFTIP